VKLITLFFSILILANTQAFGASNLHLVDSYSLVKSMESREPQRIFFYENPEDNERVIYEFCLSKKKEKCQILGSEKGVKKSILAKETKRHEWLYKFLTPFQPVAEIAAGITFIYLAVQSGGTVAFMAGTGSVMAFDGLHKITDPQKHKEYSDILNPESQGRFRLSGVGIVEFSYILEKKIKKLTKYCFENPKEHKCVMERLNKTLMNIP